MVRVRSVLSLAVALVISVCIALWGPWKEEPPPETHSEGASHMVDAISGATRLAGVPTEITDISTYEAFAFDPLAGEPATLSYQVSRESWIRIRIVRRGFKDLLLMTLMDWTKKSAGTHEAQWDGRDGSGNLLDPGRCFFVFDAHDWRHGAHGWWCCQELDVELIAAGHPLGAIRADRTIGLRLLNAPAACRAADGFRLRVYVDDAVRESDIFPPDHSGDFFARLDPAEIGDGPHTLTLVLDDGEDHLGTVSRYVGTRNGSSRTHQ